MDQKYKDVLESLDWSISDFTNDGRVEIQKYSPAGEDFCICVDVENFPEAVAECAADFDIDEHIEMWIEAKNNGVRGVPSTRELVEDAEAIDKMLQELAARLMATMDGVPYVQYNDAPEDDPAHDIAKMISINTCHLTEATLDKLKHNKIVGVVSYPKRDPSTEAELGAFVFIQSGYGETCDEDLLQCIRFAEKYGCEWINFSIDGEKIDALKNYEEEN